MTDTASSSTAQSNAARPDGAAPSAVAVLDRPPAERRIPTRRISFEEVLEDLPKFFAADGDLLHSHLAAALSSVFPDGEDFFVRSVRHFRDQVTDPQLRKDVAGFIGQEATHGREHRMLNERLDELGYHTKRAEKITRWGLNLRWKVMPAKSNLAATAALEHFTATLAELLLADEEARALFGHGGLQDLFVWHALEELEHKSVAFDVYRAVGGTEGVRIFTMVVLRWGFILGMAAQIVGSVLEDRRADPASYPKGSIRASWQRFKRSPVLQPAVWRQLKEYDRRGFHPEDRDTTALAAEWRERLFGAEGELNPLLAGATA